MPEPDARQQADAAWEQHCVDIVTQLAGAASREERYVIMAVFVVLGGEQEFLTTHRIDPVTYEPLTPDPGTADPGTAAPRHGDRRRGP